MKKYKIILRGMGIFATGIISFKEEPTLEQVENETALYLNEKLLKVEPDSFHADNRYILTYEYIKPERVLL
tara:strand:- start:1248 stop:1460 length:213 start_codon:yes stop_codon:yes gene_type:complete